MTVNEMTMLSYVFLGFMFFYLIAAAVVFFLLDVRKAWRIVTGKKVPVQKRKNESIKTEIFNKNTNDLVKKELQVRKKEMNSAQIASRKLDFNKRNANQRDSEIADSKIADSKIADSKIADSKIAIEATTLLNEMESTNNQYKGFDVTTVLKDTEETTVLVRQEDKESDIVMDITFIHTEVTL